MLVGFNLGRNCVIAVTQFFLPVDGSKKFNRKGIKYNLFKKLKDTELRLFSIRENGNT